MKNSSDLKDEFEFKQFLSIAFRKTPPAPAGEFQKLLEAYRDFEGEPFWFRLVGSPLSTLAAATMLVLSISLSQVDSEEYPSDEGALTWVTDREVSPLVEVYSSYAELNSVD